MVSETVLIPKDRYERLLRKSELYDEMKKDGSNEDFTSQSETSEPVSKFAEAIKTRDDQELVKTKGNSEANNEQVPTSTTGSNNSSEDKEVMQQRKRIKSETGEIRQNPPPGLPMNVVRQRLKKLRKDLKNKRLLQAPKVKNSKEWQTW